MPYDRHQVLRIAQARCAAALAMRRSGKTYRQIADELGVSASRASQIVLKAEKYERRELVRAALVLSVGPAEIETWPDILPGWGVMYDIEGTGI